MRISDWSSDVCSSDLRQTIMLIEEIEAHGKTDIQLQRAKEVAEAANLAKSRYIVGVSHEIRSPLNIISGYAQLIERNPTEHVEDAIKVIRRSASHLVNLVDGLLDIARIENGSLRSEEHTSELQSLMRISYAVFCLKKKNKIIVLIFTTSHINLSHLSH